MFRHRWPLSCLLILALACPALTQTVYNKTPDWKSSDKHYSTGAALVDLNLDGWLDLVVANGNDMAKERVSVYYNKGDGTFNLNPDWTAQDVTYNGHLDVTDVNGDGWPDVAVCHLLESTAGNSAAKVYLNNSGTLSSLPDWSSNEVARAFGVSFGDVNNDGKPDLAVATGWGYSPKKYYKDYVYMNVGGQLEQTASWQSADLNTDWGCLFTDADDDGWLDLVYTGIGDNTRVYRNLGGTLDTTPVWNTTDNPNQNAIMIDYGDVDFDGYNDLFVTDNYQLAGGSGDFRQYSGLAGGYYTATPTWSYFEGYGSALALADVDGDDDFDLATGGWWDYTRLFYNDGSGFPLIPSWNSGATSVVEKIVFGDVDADSDSVKPFTNVFLPDGTRRLFHLSRRHFQTVTCVMLDGVELLPHQFTANREHGWITVHTPPLVELKVEFDYSISQDMAISNWDPDKGNYLYYNQREIDWLTASPGSISAATGGTVDFHLNARKENGGRDYLLLGGVTGTSPGTPLPGGEATLPLNWDAFTNIVISLVNTAIFDNFMGTLDGSGTADAKLDTLGPTPGMAGTTLYFAYTLNKPWNFTSNAVTVSIVP